MCANYTPKPEILETPRAATGGECLFRPICDVRIRLVRRKAVMSARAGRRRLFRRISSESAAPDIKTAQAD